MSLVSYVGCIGLLVVGIMSLSTLDLAPVEVTLGVLLICSLRNYLRT